MTVFEKRPLERVRYWQGQMLRSADFRAQSADTAQHRWWHNRALHNAYGVYQGLTASVAQSANGTFIGVNIAAGIGYDIFGRELIVDSPQTVTLPVNVQQPPVTMVLLITYAIRDDCNRESMQEICWTTVQTASTVSFIWRPLNSICLKDGVPLAHVIYDGKGDITLDPSFVPPGSRPMARPTIASGATLPATTAWDPWTINAPTAAAGALSSPALVGVQTTIDTSAAGFTRTPCYYAWLGGPLLDRNMGLLLPDMFSSITGESPTGFTFQMWFPPPPPGTIIAEMPRLKRALAAVAPASIDVITPPWDPQDPQQAADFMTEFTGFARRQKLYVQWMACQMPPTVPFVPLRLRILNNWLLPLVLQKIAPLRNLIK